MVEVPAGGGVLDFTVTRITEDKWDYFFVEAVRPGEGDWTTLPDQNGHTSRDTGYSCAFEDWRELHPFLRHYQSSKCEPTGTTGVWRAATGDSDGAEDWSIDLSGYAGQSVRISLTYASDPVVKKDGVMVDDIVTPNGSGSTSFETDGNVWDGWNRSWRAQRQPRQ